MAKFLVYVETVGDAVTPKGAGAHVPSLPGASVRAKTVDEARQKIRGAVEEYLRLLREVGEPVPRVSEGLLLDFEETDSTTFPTDFDALRANEMETMMRWLAVSRQELLGLVKDLSEEDMSRKSAAGAESIKDVLHRLAEADIWYTDRLEKWPESVLFRLAAARGVALERLRGLTEAQRARTTIFDGEEWTPRKVIRRMLEHERECVLEIKEILLARQAE